jgi:hypothetical protein
MPFSAVFNRRGGSLCYGSLTFLQRCRVLVQSRITQVVYRVDPHPDSDGSHASRILLRMAGVHVRRLQPEGFPAGFAWFTNAVDTVGTAVRVAVPVVER